LRVVRGLPFALFAAAAGYLLALALRVPIQGDDTILLLPTRDPTRTIISDFNLLPSGFWRPATRLLYRLGNSLWGLASFYSTLALSIHLAVAALLAALLARRDTGPLRLPAAGNWAAWLPALALVAAPAPQEAYLFLFNSGDLLVGFALLVACAANPATWLAPAMTVLALLAKESGIVVLPLLLVGDVVARGLSLRVALRTRWREGAMVGAYVLFLTWRLFGSWEGKGELLDGERLDVGAHSLWLMGAQFVSVVVPGVFVQIRHTFLLSTSGPASPPLPLAIITVLAIAWLILATHRCAAPTDSNRWRACAAALFPLLAVALPLVPSALRTGEVVSRYLYPSSVLLVFWLGVALRRWLDQPGFVARGFAGLVAGHMAFLALSGIVANSPWNQGLVNITTIARNNLEQIRAFGDKIESEDFAPGSIVVLEGSANPFSESAYRNGTMISLAHLLYPSMPCLLLPPQHAGATDMAIRLRWNPHERLWVRVAPLPN